MDIKRIINDPYEFTPEDDFVADNYFANRSTSDVSMSFDDGAHVGAQGSAMPGYIKQIYFGPGFKQDQYVMNPSTMKQVQLLQKVNFRKYPYTKRKFRKLPSYKTVMRRTAYSKYRLKNVKDPVTKAKYRKRRSVKRKATVARKTARKYKNKKKC